VKFLFVIIAHSTSILCILLKKQIQLNEFKAFFQVGLLGIIS
jgi:hypothetical protein